MSPRPSAPPAAGERRSPTPAAARKRLAIRHLKQGLAGGEFVLHYQPLVAAADGRPVGTEALLRWRRPEAAEDDLADLLLAAERSPVIFSLENWTLTQALGAAAGWRRAGLEGLKVAVNVSAREFPRARLVTRLEKRLAAAGLGPEAVDLEITETSSLHEFETVAEEMTRLSEMGFGLWLDDFGTGHSSLEWLSHLPCHGIKIAGTFVERFRERASEVIVGRVIDLAHDLGLRVIGEGVETEAQRDFLLARGCDVFQGFLFHAPMPAEEIPSALGAHAERA